MNYASEAQRGAAVDLRHLPGRQRTPAALELVAKRFFDVIAATLLVVILSPLFLLASLAIKFGSSGPVIARRHYRGASGHLASIYTFRTSSNGLDAGSGSQTAALDVVLRSTGIKKMPQLINVIRGDMSLVGIPLEAVTGDDEQSAQVASYALSRHVKPGIVGLTGAHVASTGELTERRHLDLWYINNWSLSLDLQILARAFTQASD